jgi:plasmid maintenance system antidote protein VapI
MDIHQVISTFGTIAATARALGVSRQTIYNWINGRKKITELRKQDIEIRLGKRTPAAVA